MNRILGWLLAGVGFLPVGVRAAPSTLAYYESNSQHALVRESPYLRQIAADLFAVDAAGDLSGMLSKPMMRTAAAANIRVFATVSNFGANGFSEKIAHAVLTEAGVRARVLAGLGTLARRRGVAGVNIDFENVRNTDRAAYSAFMRMAGAALHGAGAKLVVSVPAALSGNPADSWTGAFDYAVIGAACDIFQLMTYDENGPWGRPGPVAGLDWVRQSLSYTLSVVPAGKISLGMAAYGYDWNETAHGGVQIGEASVPALIRETGAVPQWDARAQSPFFSYTAADGSSHVVWYENARSAKAKAALTASQGLAGVSVYALGFDDPTYWQAILAGFAGSTQAGKADGDAQHRSDATRSYPAATAQTSGG